MHGLTSDAKKLDRLGYQSRRLARVIADVWFHEFRRQLEYKTKWYGSELVVASGFFPSSEMCSGCGHVKKDLTLTDRVHVCDECRLEIDRDLNASLNLIAASWTKTQNACGEDVRHSKLSELADAASMKQELNAIRRNVLFG